LSKTVKGHGPSIFLVIHPFSSAVHPNKVFLII
jgi:hypothetical protein